MNAQNFRRLLLRVFGSRNLQTNARSLQIRRKLQVALAKPWVSPLAAETAFRFSFRRTADGISPSGYSQTQDWQRQIRKCAEEQDWASALRVLDQEISRAPNDMDVRAWRPHIGTYTHSKYV
jgi:hypothetical protein